MMKTGIAASALACVIVATGGAQPSVTSVWQAEIFPNLIWTIQLRTDGSRLTGTIEGGSGPSDIYEGTIDGNVIAFKARSQDGDRVGTFRGTITGDRINVDACARCTSQRNSGRHGHIGSDGAQRIYSDAGS